MGLFDSRQAAPAAQFNHRISDQIKVTPDAQEQLQRLVDDEEGIVGVRVFVYGGGCGGMNYGITFVDEPKVQDCVLEQGDLRVYVDPVALGFLEGVEIDYQTQGLNRSLVFRNVFQSVGGAGVCGACGAAGGGGCA